MDVATNPLREAIRAVEKGVGGAYLKRGKSEQAG